MKYNEIICFFFKSYSENFNHTVQSESQTAFNVYILLVLFLKNLTLLKYLEMEGGSILHSLPYILEI